MGRAFYMHKRLEKQKNGALHMCKSSKGPKRKQLVFRTRGTIKGWGKRRQRWQGIGSKNHSAPAGCPRCIQKAHLRARWPKASRRETFTCRGKSSPEGTQLESRQNEDLVLLADMLEATNPDLDETFASPLWSLMKRPAVFFMKHASPSQ